MLLQPDHLLRTSVKFSAITARNMVTMQINAKQKSADIVRPLTGHVIEECRKKTRNSTSRNYVQSAPGKYTVLSAPSAYTVTTPPYASSDFSGSQQYDFSS